MNTIKLNFQGYWREINFSFVPNYSGIYVFQECINNPVSNIVSLIRILYIGQAVNCRDRILNHEQIPYMNAIIPYGSQLCVNVCNVTGNDKDIAEAALIFKHKPKFNTQGKDSFEHETTTINNSGSYSLLLQNFTVSKTGSKIYPWLR